MRLLTAALALATATSAAKALPKIGSPDDCCFRLQDISSGGNVTEIDDHLGNQLLRVGQKDEGFRFCLNTKAGDFPLRDSKGNACIADDGGTLLCRPIKDAGRSQDKWNIEAYKGEHLLQHDKASRFQSCVLKPPPGKPATGLYSPLPQLYTLLAPGAATRAKCAKTFAKLAIKDAKGKCSFK